MNSVKFNPQEFEQVHSSLNSEMKSLSQQSNIDYIDTLKFQKYILNVVLIILMLVICLSEWTIQFTLIVHCLSAHSKNTVSNFTYIKNLINYYSFDYLIIINVKIIYDFSIIVTAGNGGLRIVKHFHYSVMDLNIMCVCLCTFGIYLFQPYSYIFLHKV